MICIKTQHLGLNRILLLVIGLWPYQQSRSLARFQVIFVSAIMMSLITFQLTTFITTELNPDHIIKILSSALFHFTLVIKYLAFRNNIEIIKNSFELIQRVCDELQDANEINIIQKYGNLAKRYTAALTLLSMFLVSIIISVPFWPRIIDIFLPMNESRRLYTMPVVAEYFIDQETYMYLIMLHFNIGIFLGNVIEIATGTMLIGYYKYICAMFRIASYRIELAMKINVQQRIDPREKIIIRTMSKIVRAVDMHRKAMKSAKYLLSNFEISFFFLIAIGVTSLSLNLFRILQIVTFEDDITEIFAHFIYANVILLYIFIGNYVVQQVTDHNNHVFVSVYNAKWYTAPLQVQRTILFLLQRGTKSFNLILGGLFVPSLKSAATLASTSISYFTVLYSTRL